MPDHRRLPDPIQLDDALVSAPSHRRTRCETTTLGRAVIPPRQPYLLSNDLLRASAKGVIEMGRSRAIKLWFAAWVTCGLGILVASGPALANTITVTSTNDAGAGSLRQAIIDVTPGGTIVVPSGSYGVASGELAISKSLTISGAGAASTIISNVGSSRVFHTTGSGNAITISGVTVSLGHPPTAMGAVSGGGVLNDGANLTLSDDVIADNYADADAAGTGGSGGIAEGGGVFNGGGGTLVVEDSEITGNRATARGAASKAGGIAEGGGIETGGTQSIQGSTFSDNTADTSGGAGANGGITHGGGLEVAAAGPTSLSGSTFTGNVADGSAGAGGAIGGSVTGGGAFVLTNAAAVSASNITFTNNLAKTTAGGVVEAGGLSFGSNGPVITLTNATLSANTATGGDAQGGDAALGGSNTVVENTIVSAGVADSGSENCVGSPFSAGHNLDSLDQCNFHASGDQVNTDPLLGPLSDNGGPVATMTLEPGSPAIDAGTNTRCPAMDARGVLRPTGPACDIGAVEIATPEAKTGAASSLTAGAAVLNGSASNPDLSSATARFEFGPTTAYGSNGPLQAISGAAVGAPVALSISGLTPNTLYHFRLVVANAAGTAFGADQTFRTASTNAAGPQAPQAPQISGLTLSPSKFAAAAHGAAISSVRSGSTVSYRDTVAATTTFTVERLATGRLVGGSCHRTTEHNQSHKRCALVVIVGHFNHADVSGPNRFHFTGRVGARKLAPQRYLLVAVARNSAGAGPAVAVGFTVRRPLGH
jgi:hypothetical protein